LNQLQELVWIVRVEDFGRGPAYVGEVICGVDTFARSKSACPDVAAQEEYGLYRPPVDRVLHDPWHPRK